MRLFNTFKNLYYNQEEIINNNLQNNKQQKNKYTENNNNNIQKENIKNNGEQCYVLYVKDGDTFVGVVNGQNQTFRLAGINTPEKNQPGAEEATNFLKQHINNKVVYYKSLGIDKYNRNIVEVFLEPNNKKNINQMLLSEGLAKSERYRNNNNKLTHSDIGFLKNEFLEFKGYIKKKF